MLSNRYLKDQLRTGKNCQILYAKFHVLFLNIQWKITTKFLSTLVLLSVALKNSICAKPNQKYLNMLPSYSTGCSIHRWDKGSHCYGNAMNSKEHSIKLLAVSPQQNLKIQSPKYSLGQQNNIATILSRALPQHYVSDFEHVI